MKYFFSLILSAGLACAVCRTAAADPAGDFLKARAAVSARLLAGAGAADTLRAPESHAGQALEVKAIVSGVISAGDDRTALLNIGGNAVTLSVPPGLRGAKWLDSGASVRALLTVVPDDSSFRLDAVAPEGDVVAADALAARRLVSRVRSRRTVSVSRSSAGRRVVYLVDSNPGHPAGALSARALSIYAPYRGLVRRWNHRLSEADVDKITTSILYFSDINNLDPRLPVAMIIAESDFDLYSTSHTGAMGLGQLMPETARGLGVTNAYDPVQNIGAAVHILRGHLDSYGGAPSDAGLIPFNQIALTMAAYNAGPGAVRRYHGVPPYRETQRYIKRVASLYRQMCGAK